MLVATLLFAVELVISLLANDRYLDLAQVVGKEELE